MAQTLSQLFNIIETKNNITLTKAEKRDIINQLNNVMPSQFKTMNSIEAFNTLTNTFTKSIIKTRNLSEFLNEYQQNNVNEVNYDAPSYVDQLKQGDVFLIHVLGINSINTIQRILNPNSLFEIHYVHLDSKYRILENVNAASFNIMMWNYAATMNQRDGYITTPNEIKNIKAIRMYQSRIPWDTGSSGFPAMRCISVLFHEFSSQSYVTNTQRKFHFLMQMLWSEASTITGVELYPESEQDSIFTFQHPFLTFDKLTCSLGTPYTIHSIYHDRDTCTFTYGASTSIVCSQAHLFDAETWITITGFTTNNISADNDIINSLNSPYGHNVSIVNATTLNIAYINTSTITPSIGLTANVYFDRRRIHIPLEFVCLK